MEELENVTAQPEAEMEITNTEGDNQPTAEGEQSQTQTEPFLKVKYNKEEIELDRDKVIELAQKGLNYDKVHEKLSSYENNKLLKYLEQKGFDPEQLVSQWEQEEREQSIQDYAYRNNVDYGIAQKQVEMEERLAKFEAMQRQIEESKQKEEMTVKEFTDYSEWYRDTFGKEVDVNSIPQEVIEIKENTGKSFRDAHMEFEFKKLITQQKEIEQQQKNAQLSTGSVTNNGTTTNTTFTPEMIENMSVEEMNKHWNNPAFRKVLGW